MSTQISPQMRDEIVAQERELRAARRLIACFERLNVGCRDTSWHGWEDGNGKNVGDALERARKQYYKVKGDV